MTLGVVIAECAKRKIEFDSTTCYRAVIIKEGIDLLRTSIENKEKQMA